MNGLYEICDTSRNVLGTRSTSHWRLLEACRLEQSNFAFRGFFSLIR